MMPQFSEIEEDFEGEKEVKPIWENCFNTAEFINLADEVSIPSNNVSYIEKYREKI